ncbi:RHS repeat-associated core domain-containing protein [Chitinophaga sp. Mgbs1]|uniref:RHS repeat-associated core domain-containing protein n=1 Tax=Chitinophaga solisilvae TaxID=1233460 RepID=A0A433WJN2_9BACT|nr:RHS repeat-associated core domain-containing protein [Chitinophaga solisilvae]
MEKENEFPDSLHPHQGQFKFNGKLQEAAGWHISGHSQHAYHPTLMRFLSPDNVSPFGQGGGNAYAYCGGDPVNRTDPSGH